MATNLPADFIRSLSKLDHFDPKAFISVHESGEQVVSVHMNPEKTRLKNEVWDAERTTPPFDISGIVPWAPDAYYLTSRPSFTLDPLFHSGSYYVQEASGMFLAFALKKAADLSRTLRVLDLCAAPGGKSTLIQSLITTDSLLVSNEVIKTRVPVLYQNMTKWGFINGVISSNDPAHFKSLRGYFDIIVADAPCSGSGLFRKDPDAAREWSPDGVKMCCQRQQRILTDVWDSLKEDGLLIYSTCSYSKEENEDILDSIFKQYSCESVRLFPEPSWNIVETVSDHARAFGYRFYPYNLMGEGFFLSVIQKKKAAESNYKHYEKLHGGIKVLSPGRIPKSAMEQVYKWIREESICYIPVGESVHALQNDWVHDFELLKKTLYLKKAGVRVGKAGVTDWIPDHELALANILKQNPTSIELSKQDALNFLRGESFDAGKQEKGWHLVSYGGLQMGWVKILDKRINNYYPKSWRIRK